MEFSQGHPKPAFSEKVERADQGKFFKNRSKSSLRLKGPKALCRKWHYPLNSILLRCKDCRKFWRRKRCKGGTKGNFSKNRPKSSLRLKGPKALCRKWHYPLNSILLRCKDCRKFWRRKRCKGGTKGNFSKNRPKSSLRLKGPKALCRKWHYPQTSMLLRCKDWRRFWRGKRLQKCPNGEVMAIFARSPKTRIF